jgi:hypothetical protein
MSYPIYVLFFGVTSQLPALGRQLRCKHTVWMRMQEVPIDLYAFCTYCRRMTLFEIMVHYPAVRVFVGNKPVVWRLLTYVGA